jgi:hypothetical protein
MILRLAGEGDTKRRWLTLNLAHMTLTGSAVHVCKLETLREAYALAKRNDGAPGSDGVTFEAIEAQGVEAFLEQIPDELVGRSYAPLPAGSRKSRRTPARSASSRFLRSATGWRRVRSSSYWNRSSRRTSNRGRSDTDRNGQLMKGWSVWRERSFGTNARHRHRLAQLFRQCPT